MNITNKVIEEYIEKAKDNIAEKSDKLRLLIRINIIGIIILILADTSIRLTVINVSTNIVTGIVIGTVQIITNAFPDIEQEALGFIGNVIGGLIGFIGAIIVFKQQEKVNKNKDKQMLADLLFHTYVCITKCDSDNMSASSDLLIYNSEWRRYISCIDDSVSRINILYWFLTIERSSPIDTKNLLSSHGPSVEKTLKKFGYRKYINRITSASEANMTEKEASES